MKWVALAIVAVLVPYTVLTLHYRKPGPAFRPYEDIKNRANVVRLLSAGYQRIPLLAQRPTDPLRLGTVASVSRAPGGLPADLQSTLVEPPLLPAEILQISAGAIVSGVQSYPIQFTCRLADDKQQLAGADLYLKQDKVVITPTFERVGGGLLTRTREPAVVVTIPAGVLEPGNYRVTVAGTHAGCTWPLEVR